MRKIVTKLIRSVGIVATAVPLLVTNIPNALADSAYLLPTGDYSIQFSRSGGSYNYQTIDDSGGCNGNTDYIYVPDSSGSTYNKTDWYYTSLSSVPDGTNMTGIRFSPCAGKYGGTHDGHLKIAYNIDGCYGGNDSDVWWNLTSTSITTQTEKTDADCFPRTKTSGSKLFIIVHYDDYSIWNGGDGQPATGGLVLSRLRYRMAY